MTTLHFDTGSGHTLTASATRLIIAGWTGRDAAAIHHHIEELAALGVPRPSTVPLYYRGASNLLTQVVQIDVLGDASSGEVEPVLVRAEGQWWLTVGSDHTDRAAEAIAVDLSKQLCAKPVARAAWRWSDVAERADTLTLQSEVFEQGRWVLYQQGVLAQIRPLTELLAGLPSDVVVEEGLVMFCGTFAAIPDAQGRAVRPADRMRLRMTDPATGRSLEHDYFSRSLPRVA
jgi:hypothetical protein